MGQDVRIVSGVPIAANFALQSGAIPCSPLIIDSVTGIAYYLAASDVVTPVATGSGTVTSVGISGANGIGVSGSPVTGSGTIALSLGDITPTTVNGLTLAAQAVGFTIAGGTTSKTLTVPLTASVSGTNTGDQTNISGNAATVTTNANLTGPITSSGNATSIASQTGTGTKFVVDTSPQLITPALGAATATSINFGQTTLNYYGQGTWTPIDSSGASLSLTVTNATYTRIGRMVFVRMQIAYPVTADASAALIGGLPFTNAMYNSAPIYSNAAAGAVTALFNPGATTFAPANTTGTNLTNVQMSAASVVVSAVFEV